MTEPEIPVPASSGATDRPDAVQSGAPQIPPPPQGAMDAPPSNAPAPAGASDTPPESTENVQPGSDPLASVRNNGQGSGLDSVAGDVLKGAGKGLGETVSGIGTLLNKIPGVGEILAPKEGLAAEKGIIGKPEGTAQWVGYGGENLAEFMLGDEALKGLSMADKFKQISGAMGLLEKSPRLMRAIQMGADVGKAATELGPEEQAAIKKSPMLARLVGAGMDAIRQGAVQGAQTLAKTGSPEEAAKQGAETGAASGVLGSAFGVLGRAAEKAGAAGEAVKEASAQGANAPTTVEAGQKVADQIQAANDQMHGDFEAGIQKLKGDLGDQKVPYAGSPIQKAATEAMEGRADVPANKTTTLGTAFQGLAGGSDKTLKMLTDMTQPGKTGDLTIDELVQRRQQLGEKIGNILKGSTSSEDRADVQVYQKLRDGIDDTIDSLAKQSGNPEASKDYDALRAAYKDKVNLFKEPVVQAMMPDPTTGKIDLDNAANYLLKGGKVLDKVNTLTNVIGDQGVKEFGKDIIGHALSQASTETGQINPAKFVKDFKTIDQLPPEVKEKLFDLKSVDEGLGKLSTDLKSAANYQKLVRAGVLSAVSGATSGAAGAIVHPAASASGIAVALGLAGEKGANLLDKIANSPTMWKYFRTAGKIGATLEASPAARRAVGAAGYGAGNALGNIMNGAAAPLSNPDEDHVVYSNQ